MKFIVNIDGEPAPCVTWLFNDSTLPNSIDIDNNKDYLSKFVISKAIRKQTGNYTIKAANDSGTDSVVVKVFY